MSMVKTLTAPKKRYWVPPLFFFGLLFSAICRTSISIAMPVVSKALHFSPALIGGTFSAFFLGYVVMQLPGGYLVDRLGPRWTTVAAVAWYAILTALIGAVHTFGQILIILFLAGMGAQLEIPAIMKAIANWFPRRERSTASGVILGAIALGPAIVSILMVNMIHAYGWSQAFYNFLIPGLVIAAILAVFVRNDPRQATWIAAAEIDLIEADVTIAGDSIGKPKASYLAVLKVPVFWVLAIAYLLFNVAFWGFISWLPMYLVNVRHFALLRMGYNASLPYVAGFIGSYLGGRIADRFHWHRGVVAVCYLLTALAMLMAYSVSSPGESVLFLTLTGLFMYAAFGPFWALALNLVPKTVVGGSTAVINLAGNVGGFIAPTIIGLLVAATGSYSSGFWTMALAVAVAAALIVVSGKLTKPVKEIDINIS